MQSHWNGQATIAWRWKQENTVSICLWKCQIKRGEDLGFTYHDNLSGFNQSSNRKSSGTGTSRSCSRSIAMESDSGVSGPLSSLPVLCEPGLAWSSVESGTWRHFRFLLRHSRQAPYFRTCLIRSFSAFENVRRFLFAFGDMWLSKDCCDACKAVRSTSMTSGGAPEMSVEPATVSEWLTSLAE